MKLSTTNTDLTERKIGECVNDVLNGANIRRATAFISSTLTIKATAQHRFRKNERSSTMLVTVGRPNFVERRFIRICQKAGVCFPLRQIQWKHWTKKK